MLSDRPTIVDTFDPRRTLKSGDAPSRDTEPMPDHADTLPMPEPWLGYREDRAAMLPPAPSAETVEVRE